ncbi:hypothetical protein [Thermoflavimicrobium dichotomicum]|uniref:FlgD Ig-like domain-containing protein n=1 Tax=Thermoflavimicrobium dichotomicum TaxID=46223 RepID=A0A1I3T7Z6_9BACL|nr:hypothetical protein [Thermoflavimicrobium dichotomicum]SFJ67268.1 hypothetical protein SAMN05421852_11660 [Thermoflavimicrobium dichotomicum]
MKKVISSIFALSLLLTVFANSAYAKVIDGISVHLDPGEDVRGVRLYVSSSNDVAVMGGVYRKSKHSVIFKIKDPSGHVVKQVTMRPGQDAGEFWSDWTPKTGYYVLQLDCYGSAKDCSAAGRIVERN